MIEPDQLARLADAYGVARSYRNASGQHVEVPTATVQAVLRAMGVVAETSDQVEGALAEVAGRPWRRLVAPTVVVVQGEDPQVRLHVPADAAIDVRVELEEGGDLRLDRIGPPLAGDERGGVIREARAVELPPELPLGYHRLAVEVDRGPVRREEGLLIVAPPSCPDLAALPPAWGWMIQLYALRSRHSWGIGDLGDLAELVAWSGAELGADFVVCNPLHAITPAEPIESSPYYPSSRRFFNPLALRAEDLPAFAAAPPEIREQVQRLGALQQERNRTDRIDRDAAWAAKRQALALLHEVDDGFRDSVADYRRRRGVELEDFATFCALAERHGGSWRTWPAELRDPTGPAVVAAREELAREVDLHAWLQWCCEGQLAHAQAVARQTGMSIGVIHDLAVGVDPGGADAWALQDELAADVHVGAPPDPFNQRGQNWRQPPLRPDRLAETGYRPYRDMLAAVLRHAGGLRIDHVMGLFRLWWIPEGAPASHGTFVAYPARDLLAILALEAQRAGAIVVGEDLGTVDEEIRAALRHRGVAGSRVLYFERAEPGPNSHAGRLRAAAYPARSLASVSTHDLPTAAGWWSDEGVRMQARLGLLSDDTTLEAELERAARDKAELRALLVAEGVLSESESDPVALREAMHAFLARCGSRLVAVQPADAVGDPRQPNLPGTLDEYPSWRLPLARPSAHPAALEPVLLEDLRTDEGVARVAELMRQGRAAAGPAVR